MSLDLTPNEYRATSRDYYETAVLLQDARRRGIEDAREAERKRKASEGKAKDAIAQMKAGAA